MAVIEPVMWRVSTVLQPDGPVVMQMIHDDSNPFFTGCVYIKTTGSPGTTKRYLDAMKDKRRFYFNGAGFKEVKE